MLLEMVVVGLVGVMPILKSAEVQDKKRVTTVKWFYCSKQNAS